MPISKTDQLNIEQVSTPQGANVIRVTGWVTIKNAPEFESAIDKAKGTSTILDMSGVQYMDSSGLGTLLRGYVACQKYGGDFVLAGVVPRVRDLLQLTKIESLFRIYPTVDEAADALAKKTGAGA